MASNKFVSDVKKFYKASYNINDTLQIKSIQETIIKRANSPALTYSFDNDCKITLTTPEGDEIITTNINEEKNYKFLILGSYIIRYSGTIQELNNNTNFPVYEDFSIAFHIAVAENRLPLKKWTIASVIKRLLDVCEPIRKGEKPRFKLNAEQEKLFDKIPAPQFSFTKQTLRECLQECGKVIHGEPRLTPVKDENGEYYYEVSYDMFASQEESGIYTKKYILKTVSQVIDSYTAWLDTNAENLVNQLDKFSGVIVEPYRGGAKTVRTENLYVRIEDSNMLIPTQYPIYSVDKLEYVYNDNGTLKTVDISPWLFERRIYDSQLSSYAEQYPYSKAYGIYFSQGEKNIRGLNFKVDAAVAAVFKNYAIVNILRKATGNSNLFPFNPGTLEAKKQLPEMAFRVTYTPIYNARIAQTKQNYIDFPKPAALIYNQASNIIETRYYGENLKGVVARLGNVDKSITYRLYRIDHLPRAGQMYNKHYYISAVAISYLPTCILCTISLSKDFNRLSAYIGVNSEKRYYEISENQAVERDTLWREYILISDKPETPDEDCLIGSAMITAIAYTFTQEDYEPLTNVLAWGESYKGNVLPDVSNLPLISSAFGTSISFSWRYEDNYSAGAISHYENTTSGAQGYFQNSYPYTDYYGRIYYYHFVLQPYGKLPTATTLTEIGTELPKGDLSPAIKWDYVTTEGKTPYILRKDNREILQCNFQIDFVTNTDIIIGSALASNCPAIRGSDSALKAKLYVFPTELNKFTGHIEAWADVDLTTLPSADISVEIHTGYFEVHAGNFPASGKSWAIVTAQTKLPPVKMEDEEGEIAEFSQTLGGDLLIGRNIEVSAGQEFTPINFIKKREIFDKTVWKDRR